MEFRDIFVTVLIIGLFAVALITFAVQIQTENDVPNGIAQDTRIMKVFGNLSKQLNSSTAEAEASRQGLIEEEKNPTITSLGFVFKSILAAGNTFMSMILNIFTYIFVFGQELLNISPIVTGTIMAIILGVVVLAIWSIIRAGR